MKVILIVLGVLLVVPVQDCGPPKVLLRGSYDCETGQIQFSYSRRKLPTRDYPTLNDGITALGRTGYGPLDDFQEALSDVCAENAKLRRFINQRVGGAVFTTINGTYSLFQEPKGLLSTSGNRPILIKGIKVVSGATIPARATIETPDGVGATIRLGDLGNICIAPNTKLVLEFDRQGNLGSVKVNLADGCAILRTKKNTAGTFNTAQGLAGNISAANGGSIDVCLSAGGTPSVDQGSAANAGAGASALDCGAAGAAAMPSATQVFSLVELNREPIRNPTSNNDELRINFVVHAGTKINAARLLESLAAQGVPVQGCAQTADGVVRCPNGRSYILIEAVK